MFVGKPAQKALSCVASRAFAAALFLGIWLIPSTVFALPAYSRLFQAKYGYRSGCVLCHSNGGGSAVTDFGRDFLRGGANFGAFGKIEGRDSDGDGSANLEEIKKKANPGDARSTPKSPGDWLGDADKVPLPQKELKQLFPDAQAFAALEGSLKAEQVERIQARLGAPLTDEDKVPTLYFALKGGKKYAVALYVSVPTPKGPMSVAVALDTGAVVTVVRILKNPDDKAVEQAAFLKQFKGKRQTDAFVVGKDIVAAPGAPTLSQAVATAVHKASVIMNAVFGK